jgi:hypothetical protein
MSSWPCSRHSIRRGYTLHECECRAKVQLHAQQLLPTINNPGFWGERKVVASSMPANSRYVNWLFFAPSSSLLFDLLHTFVFSPSHPHARHFGASQQLAMQTANAFKAALPANPNSLQHRRPYRQSSRAIVTCSTLERRDVLISLTGAALAVLPMPAMADGTVKKVKKTVPVDSLTTFQKKEQYVELQVHRGSTHYY